MRISDWSSDVCSSDLLEKVAGISVVEEGKGETATGDAYEITRGDLVSILKSVEGLSGGKFDMESLRSEERRVGKECVSPCRSWWSPYNYKNTKINSKTITHTRKQTNDNHKPTN